jgi:hypothetical protein
LADSTNSTHDEVFDGALEQALSLALDESPVLNILSEASVTATLKQMAPSKYTTYARHRPHAVPAHQQQGSHCQLDQQ